VWLIDSLRVVFHGRLAELGWRRKASRARETTLVVIPRRRNLKHRARSERVEQKVRDKEGLVDRD